MPLYMDIHTVDASSFSVEEVVKAHMEDLKVQERFGVNQIKYWCTACTAWFPVKQPNPAT